MKLDTSSLPHPILRKTDGEISGRFESQITLSIDPRNVTLSITQNLFNPEIQNLIKNGHAAYFVDVSCATTLFRQGFLFKNESKNQIVIKSSALRGTVVVTCTVVAIKVIKDYSNEYNSVFFKGQKFNLEQGEVLAYSGSDTFEVDKQWENPGSKGAFFMLWKHSGKDVKYELGNDPILIKLPEQDFETMRAIKRNPYLRRTFLSLYVYPAMVFVLAEYLSERGESYSHRRWYQRLKDVLEEEKVKKVGVTSDNIPGIVQAIFDFPLSQALADLKEISDKFADN